MAWPISSRVEEILSILEKARAEDVDPRSGRLFAYVYEAGDDNVREVARRALFEYAEKNLLDFTVFRSALFFEREVVRFARALMHGGPEVVGSFTLGGTESIMLAVKAARDHYRKREGTARSPRYWLQQQSTPPS
jgi:glutamate/tyrosine decarboxylase-like PLP-dependent enzyme